MQVVQNSIQSMMSCNTTVQNINNLSNVKKLSQPGDHMHVIRCSRSSLTAGLVVALRYIALLAKNKNFLRSFRKNLLTKLC